MHIALSLERVQTRIDIIATVESAREALGTREVLGRHVGLARLHRTILLVRRLIDEVLGQGLLRILDGLSLRGERSRHNILLLDLLRVVLDSGVDLGVELAVLAHLLKCLMLVRADGVFESKVSRALH